MIQDIGNHKYNPEFHDYKPMDDDYILCYSNRKVLLLDNNIPKYKDIKGKCIYGFSIDDNRYFISLEEHNLEIGLEIFRTLSDNVSGFAIITGYHIWDWYRKNKYCGCCGSTLELGKKERNVICPKCGNIEFPKICPAVIVGIINNDKILLTKYRVGYSQYALVAGYSEIGETFEDTVRREVLEEVGLHVDKIKYYKSQPWASSGSILAGYYCTISDKNPTPKLEDNELKEATWFTREEIDLVDDDISLTREMVMLFKRGGISYDEIG